MPRRPRRPCPYPGCPRFRSCALHPTSTPYRGSSTAQGYGAAWGKPQSYISKCESGERRVDAVELVAFARVYGVPVTFFYGL